MKGILKILSALSLYFRYFQNTFMIVKILLNLSF